MVVSSSIYIHSNRWQQDFAKDVVFHLHNWLNLLEAMVLLQFA